MDSLIMAGQFILSFSIIIFLHELGHYFPARWFKVRIEKFYLFANVGFSLFKKQIGDTEWGIGWLPIGGYVKMAGMIDESFDMEQMAQPVKDYEFRAKAPWQRMIIMLGGVTVNFFLAVIVFTGVLMYWGEEYLPNEQVSEGIAVERIGAMMGLENGDRVIAIDGVPFDRFEPREVTRRMVIEQASAITVYRNGREMTLPIADSVTAQVTKYENKGELLFTTRLPITIAKVDPTMAAAKVGIEVGDKIIAIDDTPTVYYDQYSAKAKSMKEKQAVISVLRDRDTVSFATVFDSVGRLGFIPYGPDYYYTLDHETYAFLPAVKAGWSKTIGFIGDQLKAFGQMFTGKLKVSESLGSVITIGQMYGPTWDWQRFWVMTASLSALLGFFNLLPIPFLDGGHATFLLWEVITGRKASDRVLEVSTIIGFFLLVGLMIYSFGLDIMRLF